jgi:antirestriction protein ArdC
MSKKSNFTRSDKFEIITNRLVTLLENGVKPWIKPWSSTGYQNLISGHLYTGINPLLCAIDCLLKEYKEPYFLGFSQAKEKGWTIKKGSESTWIRWGSTYLIENENEDGEKFTEYRSAAKWLNVFNVACFDDSGADQKIDKLLDKALPTYDHSPDEALEYFIKSQGAKINHGGERAFYHPDSDRINLPELSRFSRLSAYYATAIHELGHWTGHESRLNRDLSGNFGSQSYAFEELIAELTAAFVLNEFNYQAEIEHHASYLDHWLNALKNDKKYFFKAVSLASKASEFLLPHQETLAA